MVCPSNCLFCFSAPYRATRETDRSLNTSLLIDIIEAWIGLGVKVIRFDGGGDPLAHPDCVTAIQRAAQLGARTAVLTAGDLLACTDLDALVEAKTYVRVSVNAATNSVRQEIHRSSSRNLSMSHVLTSMRRLADLRSAVHGQRARTEMPLGATFMVHPTNVVDIESAAHAVREAGFDHISFRVVLGADHAVAFSREAADLAHRGLARATEMTEDRFRVFVPKRLLTDSGYVPSRYFGTCVAAAHRVLVEVGANRHEAAVVPCGRYRGHGYRGGTMPSTHILGTIHSHSCVTEQGLAWLQPVASRYPIECGDCIDRSANLMFNGIRTVMQRDPTAQFYRIRTNV